MRRDTRQRCTEYPFESYSHLAYQAGRCARHVFHRLKTASAWRYGMNQSGVPDFARWARPVSVSSAAPVTPAQCGTARPAARSR